MNKILLSYLSLIIFLSPAYAADNKEELAKQKGIEEARKANPVIHREYFQCYALKPEEKATCQKEIIKNNKPALDKKLTSNSSYITAFAHESERLGFLEFLKNNNLVCDRIDEGPIFVERNKAFNVQCKNGNTYQLEFDSKKHHWSLKN